MINAAFLHCILLFQVLAQVSLATTEDVDKGVAAAKVR